MLIPTHALKINKDFIAFPEIPNEEKVLVYLLEDNSVFNNFILEQSNGTAVFYSDMPILKDCLVAIVVKTERFDKSKPFPIKVIVDHWNLHPLRSNITNTNQTSIIVKDNTKEEFSKVFDHYNETIKSTFKSLERLLEI